MLCLTIVIFAAMGRVLAIDYGEKRSGIAVTDELQLIASGLTAVDTSDLIKFLHEYLNSEQVDLIVIGLPRRMNDEPSAVESKIQEFIKELNKHFDMPIERIDERFTSKLAARALYESGLSRKKRQDKYLLDEVSATIILQSYLESK